MIFLTFDHDSQIYCLRITEKGEFGYIMLKLFIIKSYSWIFSDIRNEQRLVRGRPDHLDPMSLRKSPFFAMFFWAPARRHKQMKAMVPVQTLDPMLPIHGGRPKSSKKSTMTYSSDLKPLVTTGDTPF